MNHYQNNKIKIKQKNNTYIQLEALKLQTLALLGWNN